MNIFEVMVIATFVMSTITMISQYIDSEVPKFCDVLKLMNIFPCYEIKAYKNGKRLSANDMGKYINSPVKAYKLKEGIFYIEL